MLLLLACVVREEKPPAAVDDTDAGSDAGCAAAVEACNGVDDDCDGAIDEAADGEVRHADADGDGWGGEIATVCDTPVDTGGDCDDADASVYPGATEVCDTYPWSIDQDCDGTVDEEGAEGCADRWLDADGDEVGVGEPHCVCAHGESVYSAPADGDCDDADAWRTATCDEPVAASSADADAVIVGEAENLVLGYRLNGPFARLGEGELLHVASWTGSYVVAAPASGQVGVDDVAVATLGVRVVGVGDFDGDGVDDLATKYGSRVDSGYSWPDIDVYSYYFDIGLLQGPIAGTYAPDAVTAGVETLCSNYVSDAYGVLGDLDADGRVDLVHDAWCEGELVRWTEGGWVPVVDGTHDSFTDVGDVDGDGFDDLVLDERVFFGPDPGTWTLADADVVLDPVGDVLPADDLDGDGDPDFVLRGRYQAWVLDDLAPGAVEDLAVATIGADVYDDPPMAGLGDLDGDDRGELVVVMNGVYVLNGPLEGAQPLGNADVAILDESGIWTSGATLARVDGADGPRLAITAEDANVGALSGGAVYFFDLGDF